MASLIEISEALAATLEPLTALDTDLQISPYYLPSPTPPALDVYPGDPFEDGLTFGLDGQLFYTIRARVHVADNVAGQQLLLRLLDPATGVERALWDDDTLGGTVDQVSVTPEGVTGMREYVVDPATGGRLLGCEWRARVIT